MHNVVVVTQSAVDVARVCSGPDIDKTSQQPAAATATTPIGRRADDVIVVFAMAAGRRRREARVA